MNQSDAVLKVDVAGGVWTPRERREQVLDEFERSGMPAAKFAVFIGVKYPTFASWVQQRRQQRGMGGVAAQPAALRWVEAQAQTSGSGLRVELEGGVRIEIADEAQAKLAAVLLRALAVGGAGC